MNAELEPLSLRILSALFNGGYQGLLLTATVWLGLRFVPHTNAATRHAVGLATLLVVAALPAVHFLVLDVPTRRNTVPTAPKQVSPGVPQHSSAQALTVAAAKLEEIRFERIPNAEALFGPANNEASAARRPEPMRFKPTEAVLIRPTEEVPAEVPAASGLIPPPRSLETRFAAVRRHWRASLSAQLALGLMVLWGGGTALRLGKLLGECRLLHSLKRRGSSPPEHLCASFENLRREMGVRRKTRLLVVPSPAVPMAVGFVKPAVLLPANLYRRSGGHGLDQILRHELAHLWRGDDWSNLVQQLVKSALFFHPGVWWLSRRLTLDREIACDDHVLAATPTPRAYALLLTEFAGRIQNRNCSAAPAGWGRKSQLKERITMILDPKRNASTHLAKTRAGALTAAAALLAILTLQAAPRLELAQASTGPADSAVETIISAEPALASAGSSAIRASGGRAAMSSAAGSASVSFPAEPGEDAAATSGPRPKPGPMPQPALNVNVNVPVPPRSPTAPIPPRAIHAPHPIAMPHVDVAVPHVDVQMATAGAHAVPTPGHPAVPRAESRMDRRPREGDPLERRIERLERLIESLIESKGDQSDSDSDKKPKPGKESGEGTSDFSWDFKPHFEKLDKDFAWKKLNDLDIEKITREAQQEAERAARDAGRIAQEANRAAMNALKLQERNARGTQQHAHALEVHRKVLESQRHALEQQLGNLEAQIARLEEERDRIEARVDEHEGLLEHLEEQVEADEELELDIDVDVELDHEAEADEESSRDKEPKRSPTEPSVKRAR